MLGPIKEAHIGFHLHLFSALQCPELHIGNGKTDSSNRTYGNKVQITCNEGYHINGSSSLDVQCLGEWSFSTTSCQSETPERLSNKSKSRNSIV